MPDRGLDHMLWRGLVGAAAAIGLLSAPVLCAEPSWFSARVSLSALPPIPASSAGLAHVDEEGDSYAFSVALPGREAPMIREIELRWAFHAQQVPAFIAVGSSTLLPEATDRWEAVHVRIGYSADVAGWRLEPGIAWNGIEYRAGRMHVESARAGDGGIVLPFKDNDGKPFVVPVGSAVDLTTSLGHWSVEAEASRRFGVVQLALRAGYRLAPAVEWHWRTTAPGFGPVDLWGTESGGIETAELGGPFVAAALGVAF